MGHFARFLGVGLAVAVSLTGQLKFTAADYQRSENRMTYNTSPLVLHSGVRPNWLPDERFWYRIATAEGAEFVLVDPATGRRGPAFDHMKLAAALGSAAGRTIDAKNLPFQELEFTPDGQSVIVQAGGRFRCDVAGTKCTAEAGEAPGAGGGRSGRGGRGGGVETRSPDGKKAAFIRENNLWVRDLATNRETAVTTDGVKDFGYATDNAGWTKSDRPVLLWSPDFEADRDVSAGSAGRGRDVSGGDKGGASGAAGMEVSAAGG
jgi:dipeptidyl-peptidase 4